MKPQQPLAPHEKEAIEKARLKRERRGISRTVLPPPPSELPKDYVGRVQQEIDKLRVVIGAKSGDERERAVFGAFHTLDTAEKDYIATVEHRSTHGTHRTILLKDIRIFGLPLLIEDHIWVQYDKLWSRIEPFFQGQKVLLRGTIKPYTRGDGTKDYTIGLEKVIKL